MKVSVGQGAHVPATITFVEGHWQLPPVAVATKVRFLVQSQPEAVDVPAKLELFAVEQRRQAPLAVR